jgi:hypothetical protein
MHTLAFSELRELAESKRLAGALTIDYQELRPFASVPDAAVDTYVATLGFKPLGQGWRSIDRSRALRCLQLILHHDLAYEQPFMERETAHIIAESFLGLFSLAHARYYTNGSFEEDSTEGWDPITDSTFDHGVVACDHESIGIIWAQDED